MRRLAVLLVALMLTSCSDDAARSDAPVGITVADGHRLELVAEGFDRPTQLASIGDDRFVIGQLAGGENDGTGQIVIMDRSFEQRRVIHRDLDKPTGVAAIGDMLFVQLRDRLVATDDWSVDGPLAPVVADQPNNGRSQGSLTVAPDGALLFDTSGAKRRAERVAGSGILWRLNRPETWRTAAPVPVASGFKHAYTHTYTADGRLFSVEMTDGTFDGERASDELVVVSPGDDAGWPYCVDDNRPVTEYGGTPELCADAPRSHALFGPGATPTAVVVAPWNPGLLLVSLWIPGQIIAVPIAPGDDPHRGEVVVEGIESPQSLLVDDDRVLIVDHESGSIFALTSP